MSAEERREKRKLVQAAIERLSKAACGGVPLTAAQNAELDVVMRELNELDAADLLAFSSGKRAGARRPAR